MAALNYAEQYSQALANAFPYVLNYGALYATPNNNRYRVVDAKTIQIPSITTTGRVNADRDTIVTATRNYDNAWETKTLSNQRKWSTLVHPMDINQTNMVASISNITQTFNEFQKFPEMDAYCISKIYTDWLTTTPEDESTTRTADTTVLTVDNILATFDALMLKMDNERVPANGRILYVTYEVRSMLKEALDSARRLNATESDLQRGITRIDEVQLIGVPATLMKTKYDFTTGWKAADDAIQINMFLVHPNVVITPISYTFAQLDEPSAGSEGKYIYYEESFEDVFILNKQSGGIQFNITSST